MSPVGFSCLPTVGIPDPTVGIPDPSDLIM